MSGQLSAARYVAPVSGADAVHFDVRVTLTATQAAALAHRANGVSLTTNAYLVDLVNAVVSQEIDKGERALRALALEASGQIEIGRASPGT